MLWVTVALTFTAAAAAGYYLGRRQGGVDVAGRLFEDEELGRRTLEALAQQWRARVEYFQAPGTGGTE